MHWYISQFPMWVKSWNKIWKRALLFTKSLKLLRVNVIVIMALPNFTCFWDSSTNSLLHPVLFGLHGGNLLMIANLMYFCNCRIQWFCFGFHVLKVHLYDYWSMHYLMSCEFEILIHRSYCNQRVICGREACVYAF